MTRYLLDTTALIDFAKGREPLRSRVLELIEAGDELGVSAVNVAEFYAGLPPEQRPVWDECFAALAYWGISRESAARAGQDRYHFARQGQAISVPDALVAAAAREHAATIVTDNVKDYPMPDLIVLPLRERAP